LPISILNFEVHVPPSLLLVPVLRTNYTPLSWGLQKRLKRFKFDDNRTKQLDSVHPLPSSATISAKVASDKSLHHNHN